MQEAAKCRYYFLSSNMWCTFLTDDLHNLSCQSIFCAINFYTRHSLDYRESKTTGYFFA